MDTDADGIVFSTLEVRALEPHLPVRGTIVPRHLAAALDEVIAIVAAIALAKCLPERWPVLQALCAIGVIVLYFLLQEGLFSRTIGKFATGLKVVQYDGLPCTWRQAAIRTFTRFLELNLCSGIPAAMAIVLSKHRQRWGDRWAQTQVVFTRVLD